MSAQSTSFGRGSGSVRRPSISSRLSFAVSTAERGDAVLPTPGQVQIEDEIAEIKRYEVPSLASSAPSPLSSFAPAPSTPYMLTVAIFRVGLYNNRYAIEPPALRTHTHTHTHMGTLR